MGDREGQAREYLASFQLISLPALVAVGVLRAARLGRGRSRGVVFETALYKG